jgi:hypothetical protein
MSRIALRGARLAARVRRPDREENARRDADRDEAHDHLMAMLQRG